MSPFDPNSPIARKPLDWRGWLVVAWVAWFGAHYVKMVVEKRGGKAREIVISQGRHP